MSLDRHFFYLFLIVGVFFWAIDAQAEGKKPNVLFISSDDLNDWVGVFGGHPQAKTPNLDRFAERAVVFQNAHCPGPVCGPSRSALLSGFMPNKTGVYGNNNNMLDAPQVKTNAVLPEYFSKNGYVSISRGKIFHRHATTSGVDTGHWAFDIYETAKGKNGPDKSKYTSRPKNIIKGKPGPSSKYTSGMGSEFAWGPTKYKLEETSDYLTAKWAAEQLMAEHEKPFFLAVGLAKPHLPFYAPQEFFDLYDLEKIKIAEIREDDLADIRTPSGKQKFHATDDYHWLVENNLMKECTRAYLATCSYVDTCLGLIFDALEESPHRDNTIVAIWGDHGWHFGEKLRFRKATGWSESTRLPMMFRLPEMTQRQDCHRLVNLIDFYPTFIELCGLPEKEGLDGRSFVPLLRNPSEEWNYPTITVLGHQSASIRDESWRYIRYNDGTEELYDLRNDPMEWNNLAGSDDPIAVEAKARLFPVFPKSFVKPEKTMDAAKYKKLKRSVKGLDKGIKAKRPLTQLN